MADFTSTGDAVADKSFFSSFTPDSNPIPIDHPGLVVHPLVSPGIQVQILSVVDATGDATIGDIIAELPGHPDPVGAIFALAAAGVLAVATCPVDQHSVVRRAPRPDANDGCLADGSDGMPPAIIPASPAAPPGIDVVPVSTLAPLIFFGPGSQRAAFARTPELARPGVYIMLNDGVAYVGYGSSLGERIARGAQPIVPEAIIAIVDRNNSLTEDDGKAAERLLWSMLADGPEVSVCNSEVPNGACIAPDRYDQLHAFLAQAALALRHDARLFLAGSTRALMAGPRSEPDRLGSLRPVYDVPEGEIVELSFSGLTAHAARQDDGWLLLRGSDVRVDAVPSASASVSYLRAAWAHSGILAPAADGCSYVVTRDLKFDSGSAVSHFVAGAKGRGLSAWIPIDSGAASPSH